MDSAQPTWLFLGARLLQGSLSRMHQRRASADNAIRSIPALPSLTTER